ncbi:MAG: phosphoribosylformylglycinamidine cyclo-ligase, partial [Bacteroidales bacterium]|nr:phosphoribosylformylglycinamidine cyclo-ligase [Bacteroidales bacterium]
DVVPDSPLDAGKLVLSPTRTYAPFVKRLLESNRADIHGMVHCSGGAQTKILHFIDDLHVIKDNLFPVPPLFKLIQAESGTGWKEMYQVFNMGHRLEVYVKPDKAEAVLALAAELGLDARIVGRVETSVKKMVTISSPFGTFKYD